MEETKVAFRHSTTTETETFVYHVKVVETKLGSIKANQRIFWSELMTLRKDQQSSMILEKVNGR